MQFVLRPKLLLGIGAIIVSLVVFGPQLIGERLSFGTPDTATVLRELEAKYPNKAAENAIAIEYWAKYPDVRNHHYFGENGTLGVFGAREHYLKHGKAEARHWPGK